MKCNPFINLLFTPKWLRTPGTTSRTFWEPNPESKGLSACVVAEDGDDAQLGGRTGAVLQDEEEAIPVTATEYVIAARSLHAKSTAAQAKKAL